MTEDELRARYHEALRDRANGDRSACPTPEELLAVVERRGSEAGRLATLDHAMSCSAGCAPEFELLRAMHAAGGTARARRVRFPVWSVIPAAAAVLIVALGVRQWAHQGRGAETAVMRGGAAD